jgi:hypothetical protein
MERRMKALPEHVQTLLLPAVHEPGNDDKE